MSVRDVNIAKTLAGPVHGCGLHTRGMREVLGVSFWLEDGTIVDIESADGSPLRLDLCPPSERGRRMAEVRRAARAAA